MPRRPTLLAFLAAASPALAADVTFGALPAGARSTNMVSEVSAEICRDHLFDAARVRPKLPAGYRLLTAREYARDGPALAGFLACTPKYSGYAVGSLCLLAVGRLEVEGVRVPAAGPTPMVQFVDLRATQAEPGHWRLRLALPHETIEADVRGSGERSKRKAAEPGFMSVPFTGAASDRFWVITYFGHHHQPAAGKWRATGRGMFSEALGIPGEGTTFATAFQNGWSALSGVYYADAPAGE